MAKRRQNLPTEDDLEPSAIGLNSYYKLTAAMIVQAFSDLRDVRHPERALEAFCWLLDDGLLFCNMIGFEVDSDDLLVAVGGIRAKSIFTAKKFTRND